MYVSLNKQQVLHNIEGTQLIHMNWYTAHSDITIPINYV